MVLEELHVILVTDKKCRVRWVQVVNLNNCHAEIAQVERLKKINSLILINHQLILAQGVINCIRCSAAGKVVCKTCNGVQTIKWFLQVQVF